MRKFNLLIMLVAFYNFGFSTQVYEAEHQRWSNATVETQHAGYTGSGYVNTANNYGEWIEFTIYAPDPEGQVNGYDAYLTFANGSSNVRSADIYIDGVRESGVDFYPYRWDSWEIKDWVWVPGSLFELTEGYHTIRFVATTNEGLPNIDNFTLIYNIPGYYNGGYEAELQTWSNGTVDSDHLGFSGSGYVNTANNYGEWIDFNVYSRYGGEYDMYMVYACGSSIARSMDIYVNGQFHVRRAFESYGWDTWDFTDIMTNTMELNPGYNSIRFVAVTNEGAPNFDMIYIDGGNLKSDFGADLTTAIEDVDYSKLNCSISPFALGEDATITLSFPESTEASVVIVSSLGVVTEVFANRKFTEGKSILEIASSGYSTGMYYCTVKTDKGTVTEPFIVK